MKKYLVNKDFLPNSFVYTIRKNEYKGEKRAVVCLLILLLILLPISIKELVPKKENKIIEPQKEENSISGKDLSMWTEFIDTGVEGEFTESGGKITISNSSKLNELCNKDKITINTIEYLGENKYKLDITRE